MNDKRFFKGIRQLTLVLVTFILMAGPTFAKDVYLVAKEFTKTMPDGTPPITMWGFAEDLDGFGGPQPEGNATSPGPVITVDPLETTLNIFLRNDLTSEPVSIIIPGQIAPMIPVWDDGSSGSRTSLTQRVRSFTHEAAPNGGTATYTWNNVRPGTYIYQSGTHPAVQIQMGLYGAAKKNFAAGEAYSGVPYDTEAIIFYSEIDPVLHAAVANDNYGPGKIVTSTIDYNPQYFLINGEPFSGDPLDPGALPILSQNITVPDQVLIRFLNVGLKAHVPVLQDHYMNLIAEDGNLYTYPKKQYSAFLAPGKTKDALVQMNKAGNYSIYDRRLMLTNSAASPGGMLTYLTVIAQFSPYDIDQDGMIGNSELLTAIDDWIAGTLNNAGLLSLIDFWIAGCYHYDLATGNFLAGCTP